MQQTLVLTATERAAFVGAMSGVTAARQMLQVVNVEAERVTNAILAAHGQAMLADGVTINGNVAGEDYTLTYDAPEPAKAEAVAAPSETPSENVIPMFTLAPAPAPAPAEAIVGG